jgi:hypothetical protein
MAVLILLYGNENRALLKQHERLIEAEEMKCWKSIVGCTLCDRQTKKRTAYTIQIKLLWTIDSI